MYGARNLEAESIGRRAESTGGCVYKVKDGHKDKVEQCARYFIAGSVYLVLNSFLDWEPVERVNGRMMSFTEQKALGK